jgi:predicted XRE-type DNA-binding protein
MDIIKPLIWMGGSKKDLLAMPPSVAGCGASRQEQRIMTASRKREAAVAFETGTGNVYADLGFADAEGALVKARLTAKIAEILRERGLSQTEAARLLGIPQPKLSRILRGQFRGVSERRLMDCLTVLGRNVEIVVSAERKGRRSSERGSVSVVFAP